MDSPFKVCPFCARVWVSRDEFLQDEGIELIGYQANFEVIAFGLFLFNHDACKTTLAIQAEHLQDLHTGPAYKQRKTGQADCPGYCLRASELNACPAECECSWAREVLQIIRRWPKAGRNSAAAG